MTTRTRLGKRQVKTIIKGIGFQVLEATRKDNMARVRQLNQDLHELVQRGGYSYADGTKGSKRQAAKAVRLYRRAREHAMGLFDALKEKIERCSCPPSSHDIGLRLEVRDVDMSGASQILQHYESDIREGGLHFRTFIAIQNPETGGDWREVDVELLEQDQYTIEVLEDYTNEASYEASSANILEESSTTRNNRDQFNSALLEPRIPLTSDEESRYEAVTLVLNNPNANPPQKDRIVL